MRSRYQEVTEKVLNLAGVRINGSSPSDIHINDERFYKRALTEVELGVGESFMDGWWEADEIDNLIFKLVRADLQSKLRRNIKIALQLIGFHLLNMQSRRKAFEIGRRHYDLGNDLFRIMLDKRMNYSCAYWKDARTLDEAQENKLDLICRKLDLQPGMKVLDIGCGWGAFGKYAAEKYGVRTVGVTVSKNQVELGMQLCEGLPVEFRLQDYREVNEKFDRIVSVGMIEHVGYRNYRTYFKVADRCLSDEGLMLLHTIGEIRSMKSSDAFTHKYIFQNGMLPSIAQLGKAIEGLFVMEDWHNFGSDYDLTLMAWYENFKNGWHRIQNQYDERFFKMWQYFLLSSAGSFRARHNQLWQVVLSRHGIVGGYKSIR